MNRLMRQAFEPDKIRGREQRIRISRGQRIIAYKAPNGMLFKIDTMPIESGGEPVVHNDEVSELSSSHRSHTLGQGRVCLAENLRGWDLTRILFQCDSWARGYEIYQETGVFPDSPKKVFTHNSRKNPPSALTRIRQYLLP